MLYCYSSHWSPHKINCSSILCSPKAFHSTSRETKNNLLSKWSQFHRCFKSSPWILWRASILITDDKGAGCTEGRDWKFIPPHGPYFGRLLETAVKYMKYHVRRTLESNIATYEEHSTLLTEMNACQISTNFVPSPVIQSTQHICLPVIFNWWTINPITFF